ncbi:hypothetical protein ACEWY4_001991 [Coilia grayii]|uniref:ZP domain-containing protein n=1 Tax=Coilia grayii TaxID=363190 RepID=A0ABD1KUH4_9TELE
MPSNFSPLPDGGGEAVFHYSFKDCGFKVQMAEDKVIYQSTVGYRPKAKPHPSAISFPIECAYKRTKGWTAPFLNPGYASVEGQGQLSFRMMLLNEHFTGPAQSNSFPLGSFIPVWASVEQGGHQPLLLLLDECVASTSMVLEPMTPVHPIITNHGCLDDGKNGNSQFLPRYQTSEVILHLQAFRFALNEDIYIHCKLVAWDPQSFDEGKKMCNFIKQLGGWELMDDPSKSALCNCCDSVCTHRRKRDVDSGTYCKISRAIKGLPSRNSASSATMATLLYVVVFAVVAATSQAGKMDFSVECGKESVTVSWPLALPNEPNIDPYLVRLGYCTPRSVSVVPGGARVVFQFKEWRCGAEMMALKNQIVWSTELIYVPDSGEDFLLQRVACVYERQVGYWTPQKFKPVIELFGSGELVFSMSLMNTDFSGPALTAVYQLGSLIPISASVEQQSHQPLLLLLDECVAATDAKLGPDTLTHPFITNKGCFDESRKTKSSFLPRQRSSEMRLYLQAFAFALNVEVYLHCKLVAWEDGSFNEGKKACHDTNGR